MLQNYNTEKIGMIDWKRFNNELELLEDKASISRITFIEDNLVVIFQGFDSWDRSRFEGKIILKKTLDEQTYEGEVRYSEEGKNNIRSFKALGRFVDEEFKEFEGEWYEGDKWDFIINLDS